MCAGIALYPGKAQLLGCKHHFHDYIPPLVDPGKPQEGDCAMEDVTYFGPFSKRKVSDENIQLLISDMNYSSQLHKLTKCVGCSP